MKITKIAWLFQLLILSGTLLNSFAAAQTVTGNRIFSGTVVTQQFELIPNVTVEVQTIDGKITTTTDANGAFSVVVPRESLSVKFSGNNITPVTRIFAATDALDDVQIKTTFVVHPINESVTIQANVLTPELDQRNETVYKNTLFGRDDQLVQTLNAGINVGQHEGGGKSLEIRRFGFNLDHGGVNGGLKILVDDVQQNQASQGHGQGYLGALKTLSPELVESVSIINGPFSAAYGDFSGLGVVQIRQRESLDQQLTMRVQYGSFQSARGFFAYSPRIKNVAAFLSYEPSYLDGPFINKGRYRRDNFAGNFTWNRSENEAYGVKFNAGRNDFYSSGQIPLDLVNAGKLDRFGFVDPDNGGKVQLGTASTYYRKEWKSGATFKADAFVGRSLFDLFSNFTFGLLDPVYGDEIDQHDSRLQEGGNVQYLQPYKLFGHQSLVTVGGNIHFNQINVGLAPSVDRNPIRKFLPGNIDNPDVNYTKAHVKLGNYAGYVQNGTDFYNGHLHIEAGLRWDYFNFNVDGFEISDVRTILRGKQAAARLQPKLSAALSPFEKIPMVFYANYGRGISSQDARGVIRNPNSPKVATTDFYQTGASYNGKRFAATFSGFFIDRSNEQVYVPDDGSLQFAGRSRSYGFETKTSLQIRRYLSLNAGLTQVIRAYYPGQFSTGVAPRRIQLDSAPHTVANGSLVLNELRGFNSSLNWRHISHYRLDGEDAAISAAGHDVVDFSLAKHLRRWVDLNFSIDNLLDKHYFETQNYLESRVPTDRPIGVDADTGREIYPSRIHATPGYSRGFNVGVTFRLFSKEK